MMVLLLIAGGFAGMVVLVRVTRLMGYKAPAAQPAAHEEQQLQHGEL
jgi:hypothetical protein